MSGTCVVVADAGRARLYWVDPGRRTDGQQVPTLVECRDLLNLGRRAQDSQIFSNSRPGIESSAPITEAPLTALTTTAHRT